MFIVSLSWRASLSQAVNPNRRRSLNLHRRWRPKMTEQFVCSQILGHLALQCLLVFQGGKDVLFHLDVRILWCHRSWIQGNRVSCQHWKDAEKTRRMQPYHFLERTFGCKFKFHNVLHCYRKSACNGATFQGAKPRPRLANERTARVAVEDPSNFLALFLYQSAGFVREPGQLVFSHSESVRSHLISSDKWWEICWVQNPGIFLSKPEYLRGFTTDYIATWEVAPQVLGHGPGCWQWAWIIGGRLVWGNVKRLSIETNQQRRKGVWLRNLIYWIYSYGSDLVRVCQFLFEQECIKMYPVEPFACVFLLMGILIGAMLTVALYWPLKSMIFLETRNALTIEPVEPPLLAVQAMPPTQEVVVDTPSSSDSDSSEGWCMPSPGNQNCRWVKQLKHRRMRTPNGTSERFVLGMLHDVWV